MSALGHKRTFAVQKGMSALPPKADIRESDWYVNRAQPMKNVGGGGMLKYSGPKITERPPIGLPLTSKNFCIFTRFF
jgi:hypothetical protein